MYMGAGVSSPPTFFTVHQDFEISCCCLQLPTSLLSLLFHVRVLNLKHATKRASTCINVFSPRALKAIKVLKARRVRSDRRCLPQWLS